MTKILLAVAAGTATVMFLTKPVSEQLLKVDYIKKQSETNAKLFTAAITGGLGALVAVMVAK